MGSQVGELWAVRNLGADTPADAGLYFSWGNNDGHTPGDGYDFSTEVYAETPGSRIGGDITVDEDVANQVLGGKFRIPSRTMIKRLIDGCNIEWVTLYGVEGVKFTSKTNGNHIFMPAVGHIAGSTHEDDTWMMSRTRAGASYAYTLEMLPSGTVDKSHAKHVGLCIRPVWDPSVQ